MFTGIIESLGVVKEIQTIGSNKLFKIHAPFTSELKADQSVSHDGVCLTVEKIEGDLYQVTAVDETLKKSNLNAWKVDDKINLERCVKLGDRLDGHIVQGHVDCTGICLGVEEKAGSWIFMFKYNPENGILVDKGSITINGVSLTVVDPVSNHFSVAVIPYTYEHTNFHCLKKNDLVNLEFDVIGKYVAKLIQQSQ